MQHGVSLPSRRTRRILVALLILLLILLPLYLWPLRGGPGGLPGASALPGAAGDPRSAAAVARIPGEVWDALMGYADAPPPSAPPTRPPRNLTMIAQIEEIPGTGDDEGVDPSALARAMLARLEPSEPSNGDPGSGDPAFAPVELLADSPYGGPGTGNLPSAFAPGGYSNPNLGPWHGGGPGGGPRFSSPGPTLDPGAPGDLAPTPEPATLVLLGTNLALLGAAAWKRRRRRLETPPAG